MAKVDDELPPSYDTLNSEAFELKQSSASPVDNDANIEGSRELLVAPSAPVLEIITEPRTIPYELPSLVYEDIYEACIRYVKEHCCYSSKFVKQMKLTDIFNGAAFHYSLETFVEKRESATLKIPYSGQPIDGPENGPPPGPWEVVVHPPVLFQNGTMKIEVPHTAIVTRCTQCIGNGRVRCESCRGEGGDFCWNCCGTGINCMWCNGTGRKRCGDCFGSGQLKCQTCSGYGNMKCCKILIVTWTTLQDDFISDTFNLPPNICKMATGKRILYEEKQQVSPIFEAPDPSVQRESTRLIETHKELFRKELFLIQKQVLMAIPLTKVTYKWKSKEGEFYVFGDEKKVYFQDYPQKCCCCTCF